MQMTRQKSNSSSLLLGIKIVWGLPVVMAKNYSKCIPTSHGPQVAAPENSHTTSCLFPFLEGLPRLRSTKGAGSEATLLTPPSLPSCSASLIQSCADCFCDNVICWISIVQFLPTRTNVQSLVSSIFRSIFLGWKWKLPYTSSETMGGTFQAVDKSLTKVSV